MKKVNCVIFILFLSGCASVSSDDKKIIKNQPPQLWSTHKELNMDVSLCALEGLSALKSLGFTSVVQNKNFVYGNLSTIALSGPATAKYTKEASPFGTHFTAARLS